MAEQDRIEFKPGTIREIDGFTIIDEVMKMPEQDTPRLDVAENALAAFKKDGDHVSDEWLEMTGAENGADCTEQAEAAFLAGFNFRDAEVEHCLEHWYAAESAAADEFGGIEPYEKWKKSQ